jgi:hypothetical protein
MRKVILLVILSIFTGACVSTASIQPTQPVVEVNAVVEPKAVCPTCAAVSTCQPIPATPTLTFTPNPTPTQTPMNTPTQTSKPYGLLEGSPTYLQNFAHREKGCSWMGVAGQALDRTDRPISNLVIVIEGTLEGKPVDFITLTGLVSAYGPGGFEQKLSDKAINTVGTLRITLFDMAGVAISDSIQFNTYSDCKKNLILIYFKQR